MVRKQPIGQKLSEDRMKHLINMIAPNLPTKPKGRGKGKIPTANYAGAYYEKNTGLYRAKFNLDNVEKYLGSFKERWDAICRKRSYMNEHGIGV